MHRSSLLTNCQITPQGIQLSDDGRGHWTSVRWTEASSRATRSRLPRPIGVNSESKRIGQISLLKLSLSAFFEEILLTETLTTFVFTVVQKKKIEKVWLNSFAHEGRVLKTDHLIAKTPAVRAYFVGNSNRRGLIKHVDKTLTRAKKVK